MKSLSFLLCFLALSCSNMPSSHNDDEETPADSSPLVVVTEQTTRKATKEELQRSMQVVHFTEYDKNLKKSDVFFATYEPSGLKPDESFYEFGPAVIVKRDDKSPAEFISWPELIKYGWVSAAQLASKGYYWGFLDYQVEGLVNEVMIIWSSDSGKTWTQLSSLKKDYFADEFYAFTMDEEGNGSATIKRSGEGTDETKGFDIFTTKDFGKSWSLPVFHKSDVNLVNTFDEECAFGMKPTQKIPSDCAIPISIRK
jgi:hypothetical protein